LHMALNFDERPILVFWESTKACLLACKHCRAEAVSTPAPGELSTAEAERFIDSLIEFGRPYPVLIFTGGDALMRDDIFHLVSYAKSRHIPVGMAPSVTPRLTKENIEQMKSLGVKAVSISLDGALASTHETIRGISGHFVDTVAQLRRLVDAGFDVQVNTAVMKDNVQELPALVELFKDIGVKIWEVFFLIHVGRGKESAELSAEQCEDVSHFLYEASAYDLIVRTVEAPFFRRVIVNRKDEEVTAQGGPDTAVTGELEATKSVAEKYHLGDLYVSLSKELRQRLGAPSSPPQAQTSGTRDGKGIIFVAHDGTVYPAGFLPVDLGNVKSASIAEIYRNNPVLQAIRSAKFQGKCGVCEYRDLCGGSRSRAFAHHQDALAEDPSCAYEPMSPVAEAIG